MLTPIDEIISKAIDAASDDLRKLSLLIHGHPELALKEEKACAALTKYLKESGYAVEHGAGGLDTAFVATHGEGGLTIGFCSEYDALPGIGHACGHNLIAIAGVAMFLATVEVAKQCRLPAVVKLFGTPAEESVGGKVAMLKEGVFDGCDLLMMLHPTAGYSGMWHSQCSLSMQIEYFGKAAHAALDPWDGVNAGSAATIALNTLGVLREQLKPSWRMHGIITSGGQAANIIPDYSCIEYTIRTQWERELEVLRARVLNAFESAALATGCTHNVTEELAYLDNQDNSVLGKMYEEIMQKEYGGEPVRGVGASSDFGNLSHRFISLHGMYELAGNHVPNHTKEFTRDAATVKAHERTLFAAKAMACIAARCMVDKDFWERVRKDFDQRKAV
ncbi:hypothetical protein GGI25_001282 [Coemansia spiralis]|uniref:Peptidase M20 domain-containing protein 2 n=2 Tax=Coemansia TaxID=4863 RepID=A0A9W8GCQ3_9FUNG|nr:amidohydrolase [Coemansia spiralis]KAJ1994980.1 hypothetical protein EDC05_001356 [Coemansia umbellata]KAJ2624582.1 hypothetical protein GGI26_001275 [Coemansia sp. RSA 1358]KAJ2679830.1 hypothetical protein GGI25_001282 [Coemansia spiralis]